MKKHNPDYRGYRIPPEMISYAVWLSHRFCLRVRDVEELLAERRVTVSYEAIKLWCFRFGHAFAKRRLHYQGRLGDTWRVDEMFVTINGERHYLWRAIDQDGEVLDILVHKRRNNTTVLRFLRKLLKGLRYIPHKLLTDTLASYGAARRELLSSVPHEQDARQNNRVEVSHQPTRQQERQMRRFRSPGQAQRFLALHGPITNLFHLGRHRLSARHYCTLCASLCDLAGDQRAATGGVIVTQSDFQNRSVADSTPI